MNVVRRGLVAACAAALLLEPGVVLAAGQDVPVGPVSGAEPRATQPRARGFRMSQPPRPPNPGAMSVRQVEQYFDQVVLYQAQSGLRLNDGQFPRFRAGLRRLQAARRQQQRQRTTLTRRLNGLLSVTPLDEAAVVAATKELDDLTATGNRRVRDAYAAIDESLDVRQRARFRVFEETMERRKLDLVARARRAATGEQ